MLLIAQALTGCLGITLPKAKISISTITESFHVPPQWFLRTPTLVPAYPWGFAYHRLETAALELSCIHKGNAVK